MRKIVMISGAVAGVLILILAAAVFYAARNLNSIIAENRDYLLGRVGDSLGRKVDVSSVSASLGWGVMADLKGVKIGDDPAISDQPFVEANDIYARVALLPLLARRIDVTELILDSPTVRIIRTEQGRLNISTIGKKRDAGLGEPPPKSAARKKGAPAEHAPASPAQAPLTEERGRPRAGATGASALAGFLVKTLTLRNGEVIYEARGARGQSITISDVALSVEDFGFDRPFSVSLRLAAFSREQNVVVSGTIGPLARQGQLEPLDTPFKMDVTVGPLLLARLRAIAALGAVLPEKLSMPDPMTVQARIEGNPRADAFHLAADLSSGRVAWGDAFDKPAGLAFKLGADGSRSDSTLEIARAELKLGNLDAKAGKIKFGGGNLSARVDTNRFDLGSVAKLTPTLRQYNPSGQAEIHSDLSVTPQKTEAKGAVTLKDISFSRPDAKGVLLSNLSGEIRLDGNAADAGPLKFNLGSGHAVLKVHAASLKPANADYDLSVDAIKLAELAPGRPGGERLDGVSASGTVASGAGGLTVNAKLSSVDGKLANVAYKNLGLLASLGGKRLNLKSLKFDAFTGQVLAGGQATMGPIPEFTLSLDAGHIDLQQVLQSQGAKAAGMVRGILDGQVKVAGKGANFSRIKPSLRGNGRANVKDGKLVGVNIVADALNKTKNLPQIGDLVPASVVQRHPELFHDPDTDLRNASLTFTLEGPKISTSDLNVQTPDYGILGRGWFDLDKNIDVVANVVLSPQLSREIIAERKNVVYITNRGGQVDVPFEVRGMLPKVAVSPDVGQLAGRAGRQLLKQRGQKFLNKLFGPAAASSPGAPPSPAAPPNPLQQLKKLF